MDILKNCQRGIQCQYFFETNNVSQLFISLFQGLAWEPHQYPQLWWQGRQPSSGTNPLWLSTIVQDVSFFLTDLGFFFYVSQNHHDVWESSVLVFWKIHFLYPLQKLQILQNSKIIMYSLGIFKVIVTRGRTFLLLLRFCPLLISSLTEHL